MNAPVVIDEVTWDWDVSIKNGRECVVKFKRTGEKVWRASCAILSADAPSELFNLEQIAKTVIGCEWSASSSKSQSQDVWLMGLNSAAREHALTNLVGDPPGWNKK